MKRRTLLCIGLLLAVLTAALTACGDGKEPDADPTATPEPEVFLPLTGEDGKLLYTVIRGDDCETVEKEAAALLCKVSRTATGNEVVIETDWVSRGTTTVTNDAYEILVGNTNRAESQQVAEELENNQYALRIFPETHKIVLLGADARHTRMAVDAFMTEYLGYDTTTGETGTAALIVPEGLNIMKEEIYLPAYAQTGATIVETVFPTEDVVVADIVALPENYGVDPTGKTDSTAGIQKALNDCAKAGGGTVFLPVGEYLVTGTVRIPAFTTLMGDWQNPAEGEEYGTVILAEPETSERTDCGLFEIGGSAGAVGLTVYYPEQSLRDVTPYAPTFYIPGGSGENYMVMTVRNVTLVNSYIGIAATTDGEKVHEQLYIDTVYATCLRAGLMLYNSADVGSVRALTVAPWIWAQYEGTFKAEAVAEYTRANAEGMILGDLDWTEFSCIALKDLAVGVHIKAGSRASFSGSFWQLSVTDTDRALVADANSVDSRWGLEIANSTLKGSTLAIENHTGGVVKLAGTDIVGGTEGYLMYNTDDLSGYASDTDKKYTYTAPASALYVLSADTFGKTNMSEGLQSTLDYIAGEGGGIVYLSAGTYYLDTPITVPAGVQLRGSSSVANRDEDGASRGTVILSAYLPKSADADALITLKKDAGISGLRICFTKNGGNQHNAVTAVQGTDSGVYVRNCAIVTAGRGIDFTGCDNHYIRFVTAWCYESCILAGGKDGYIADFLYNPTVPTRRDSLYAYQDGSDFGTFLNYGKENTVCVVLQGAENEHLERVFAYGTNTMLKATDCKNTLVIHLGSDNLTAEQMVIDGGSFTGIDIMRYSGSSYKILNSADVTLYCRLAIYDQLEANFVGSPAEAKAVTEENPQTIYAFDKALAGMTAGKGLGVDGENCAVAVLGDSDNIIAGKSLSALDITGCDTVALDVWLSDAKKMASLVIILEVTSSGTCDVQEYEWQIGFSQYTDLKDGWNTIYLYNDLAGGTGGLNPEKINYFRFQIYWGADQVGTELRLDNLRAVQTGGINPDVCGYTVARHESAGDIVIPH